MSNLDHYHQLDRPTSTVTIRLRDEIIAQSSRTIQLKEVSKRVYDPVFYFPREDVRTEQLVPTETSSHCPIKGDASYWSYQSASGVVEDLAWSYERPLEYSEPIRGYLAFDAGRVTIEITPAAPA